MPAHNFFHLRQARAAIPDPQPVETLVSIIYVTAKPTFSGPIVGYITLAVDGDEDEDKNSDSKNVSQTEGDEKVEALKQTASGENIILPTALINTNSAFTISGALVAATDVPSTTKPAVQATPTLPAARSTSTNASKPAEDEGMNIGAKAGLAIGILLLVGTGLLFALFFLNKKKRAAKEKRLYDEKTASNMFSGGSARAASIRTTATAPRLSLRPVTEFLPNLGGSRSSRANALDIFANSASTERKQDHEHNKENPFGNHAEAIDSANARGPTPITSATGEIGAAVTDPSTIGLARGASKRGNGPKPLDFTTNNRTFMAPLSPARSEFSESAESVSTPRTTNTSAAIAAAGGPANTAVHRVQLDFRPSMEDELELRAGQLIRVLHEYDDGWALCIRLDRSQQGVCPRTCLSTRPVKPRAQHDHRPASPALRYGRPESPAGGRVSASSHYGSSTPITPQGRPQSPSVSQYNQKNSLPGPSRMNQTENPFHQQRSASPVSTLGTSPPDHYNPFDKKSVPGQAY